MNVPKRYRSRVVVKEAIKWTGDNFDAVAKFMRPEAVATDALLASRLHIMTLEGPMAGSRGDYLIKGLKGEFYFCKPDVFEASYEEEV